MDGKACKFCSRCRVSRLLDDFSKKQASPDGRQSLCKKCDNTRRAAYDRSHRPESIIRKAVWRQANSERHAASKVRWRGANSGKIKTDNAEWYKANCRKVAQRHAAYDRAYPERAAARWARRRARKLRATPPWLTPADRNRIDQFYVEARRLTCSTGVKHEVDHIVPLRGLGVHGLHVPWNLRVVTQEVNRKKNRSLDG